jgi:DNA repair exonuclease SbcCD nuclease subunit
MVERVAIAGRCPMPLTVLGRSGGDAEDIPVTDFVPDMHGALTVAVACGRLDPGRVAALGIEYWALGGRRDRKTLCSEPRTVHYPGSPQGRGPQDAGPHGCTLVEVQANRQLRLRFIPCDLVRWQHERVLVARSAVWDDVTTKLSERLHDLRSQTPDGPLLVRWTLVATDGGDGSSGLRELAQRAEKWLRQQSSAQAEPCWPIAVDVEWADRISASSYKEDTLLGDYLRAIRTLQEDPAAVREALTASAGTWPAARWVADLSDAEVRRQVMQDVAELGAALLRGEKLT